jgi:hypothetical protein
MKQTCNQRDYREGWPLLTVETELNEYKGKGTFLSWFFGHVGPVQEIFALPDAIAGFITQSGTKNWTSGRELGI